MQIGRRFCCVMIGRGGLLLECAELLIERGHSVIALVSDNSKVREWAAKRRIICVDAIGELPAGAQLADADYLFSIANGTILRQEQLEQPRLGAINYHNGPLPKYAGVHATSWAILNQEPSHGITWHLMTATVDAGSILKQIIFPLDERETTLTLNLKCYDQAFAAFSVLIDELATGSVKPIPQNLTDRSYFGGYQKWPGGGLIDWGDSAEAIDRLCRALDFGSYPNALGVAKFSLGQTFFVPRDLRILEPRSGEHPGTIVVASERLLQIATATREVAFSEVRSPGGQILSAGELIARYGLVTGARLPLPNRDLRERLTGAAQELSRHEMFWLGELVAVNPATLPLLPLETSVSAFDGPTVEQAHSAAIDATLRRRLEARGQGQAGWSSLLSAWLIYLYRHNEAAFSVRFGDDRIRDIAAGLEPLIAQDVPLNIALSAEMRFADVQRRLQERIAQIGKRGTYLHDLLLRFPELYTDPKTIPVTIAVTGDPAQLRPASHQGLTIAIAEDGSTTRLILNTSSTSDPDYQGRLQAMSEQIQVLLSAVAANPEQPIARLPLLTDDEQARLVAWNDTAVRYSHPQPAPQLFEAQAAHAPDAIAATFGRQHLSYGQLNARANQLAHLLIQRGVRPETLVGVALDRSPELLISLLAIHKAGGAHVPLDPAHPEQRLRFMLHDTQTPIVLTRAGLRDCLGDYAGEMLEIDREWTAIQQSSSANPNISIEPASLAYVMYTSGSTGQPKGVLCTHEGLTNRLLWSLDAYPISAADTMVQIAAIGFDIAVWELLFPLIAGARLVIAAPEHHKDADYLVELLATEQVTIAHFVPSLLDVFLDHPHVTRCAHLRQVVCGGEALSPELKRRFFQVFPAAQLHHAYGPTEAAISVTHWNCRDAADPDSVPLGRPIANTQIHILDQHGERVPVGVTGEIAIGGANLARGYLNRPDLTAAQFIPDPFSPTTGARLYRTGDLGRWLPDGNLEFLGRRDSQLKLRGFRVELGEIEAVLNDHPAVRQAVVVAREDQAGQKRLVAYVVEEPGSQAAQEPGSTNGSPAPAAMEEALDRRPGGEGLVARLRAHAAARLPEYMIPSALVLLDALPLTTNGKVDRQALLKLNYHQRFVGNEYVVPETALERRLAGVWSELLGVQEVGTLDNFFALGGHSLIASRMISWIRQHSAVDLPLRAVFAYPTIQSLARHITATRQTRGVSSAPAIQPVARADQHQLGFAQERLWFLDKLLPPLGLYNSPVALYLQGSLDIQALERSFERLLARHEILRSSIREIDGRAALVIADALPFALSTQELRALNLSGTALTAHPEVRSLLQDEASRPFDLARPPLIRATLVRCNADEHLLLVTSHHIVSDGWSAEILFRDLSALYNAEITGQTPSLPELPLQYLDVAAWQRRWLQGPALEEQLAFWQQELQDLPEQSGLPTSQLRPAQPSYRGSLYRQQLTPALRDRLLAVAESCEATLFMALVAAFQTLLHRYSGQDEIAIGTPFANRHHAETANLIGLFVNTVVLRASYAGDPTFVELLNQARTTVVDAYEHQDCPFEKVVERVAGSRDRNRQPLFQTMLVLNNSWEPDAHMHGLAVERLTIDRRASMFDLTLEVHQQSDGLLLEWEYSTDLFDERYVERLAGQFSTLLESIVAEPERRISRLALLPAAELHQLLIDWNHSAMPIPDAPAIQHLFEAQVERTPTAVALIAGEQQLTYQELNTWSNRLAHHLRQRGIGPGALVAISLHRSPELIAGLLGVLKAGGAYVPLDPSFPAARLQLMLADTSAPVLITQSSLAGRFGEYSGQIVRIDRDEGAIAGQPEHNPEPCNRPADLAYVIYTSGSAGPAKGVLIEHRSLLSYTAWASRCFELSAADRVLQFASISFDAAAEEIYPTLTSGGTLVLRDEELLGSFDRFLSACAQQGLTVLDLPTAYWHQLTQAMLEQQTQLPDSVRLVIIGGERALPGSVIQWHAQIDPEQRVRLINTYGPTETTIVATWSELTPKLESAHGVPIGRPVANTQVYVLDQQMQPVPIGVTGELHIGGAGLARGYLNQTALTHERFVQSPFGRDAQERLYKTGDLVRWRADGQLEYIGRIDGQVKIRGFRVEPGEIEAALAQHPAVRACVVTTTSDAAGNTRLVAYVVAQPGDKAAREPGPELRSYLGEYLPAYMIPSAFVPLDALPLLPTGKIDRQALPEPAPGAGANDHAYVAPRTPTEERLAQIWSAVLSVERIGVHDNFFALGGHSILAAQLLWRIRRECQAELSLRSLFVSPTIAGLAEEIDQTRTAVDRPMIAPIARVDRDGQLPLSFAQQRLWFLDQLSPQSALYNVPLAFDVQGPLDQAALQQAIDGLIARHEALRTRLDESNGQATQSVLAYQPMPIMTIDLSDHPQPDAALRQHIRAEALRPFDLAAEPPLRVQLARLHHAHSEPGTAERHVLLVVAHHIAADGWSMQLIFRDLSALYAAARHDRSATLPPIAAQPADFAVWQRSPQVQAILERQLRYWQATLRDTPEMLDLPTDRPRPEERTYHGASCRLDLPFSTLSRLKSLSERHNATLFMTLLASFQALLHRYTGQRDIVVGSPIANRRYAELADTVGFFVNTIALRAAFPPKLTFEALLAAVRETTVSAFEHQDVPFEQVVDALGVTRAFNRHPVFQVMFTLEETSSVQFALDGLDLREIPPETQISKFDLALTATESSAGLALNFEYTSDLFESATIERLAQSFRVLLTGIIDYPQQPIADLPLLSQAERRRQLVDWNHTAADVESRCVHELFAAQARQTPDAIAIVDGPRRATYAELNHHANLLAAALRQHGVGPETRVAVSIGRSLEHVTALLGVLKAGGAYVPLDLSLPRERRQFILDDTRAPVVITLADQAATFRSYPGALVCLDRDWDTIAAAQPGREQPAAPDNLAYITYTSGSTGRPKGVMNTHAGFTNRMSWTLDAYRIAAADALLQIAALGFDISIWEMLFPLVAGARLVILPQDRHKDAGVLAHTIAAEQITIAHFVPSLLQVLLEDPQVADCRTLRQVVCGGEALPVALKRSFFQKLPCAELHHAYGPTEAAISVTHWNCRDADHPDRVPLGYPIANTQMYVLDANQQPLPIGLAGEIAIGGANLARGYLNRPDLTAAQFIPDPFSPTTGARLYRTGDLGRWLPDGKLEFLGRIDHQLKLRGFRIEPGEIEAVLNDHPAVRQAVVVAREDQPAGTIRVQRLVAYVVGEPGSPGAHEPTADPPALLAELREHAAARLPEYMIPSAFVLLDQLPQTSTGKLDRQALPAPETLGVQQACDDELFVAPRSAVETLLAAIWADLLPVEHVGAHDNFFQIGGDSIISIQVVTRARQQGLQLEVKHIFQAPTIAGLARLAKLTGAQQTTAAQEVLTGALPLTPIQHHFFAQQLAAPNHYNQSIMLEASQPLDPAALEPALAAILAQHDALRLRFRHASGAWSQRYAGLDEARAHELLTVVDLAALPGDQQTALEQAATTIQSRLNIEAGPLVGAALFTRGDQPPYLLLAAHHLAIDAVSWSSLIEDLSTAYRQAQSGAAIQLPPKTHAYRDWAEALQSYAQSAELQAERARWQSLLAEADPSLPVDHPGGANAEADADTLTVTLSRPITQRLLQQAPRAYRTRTPDLLLTALLQALAPWTGRDDLLLALESHGRSQAIEQVDSSRTVGWFTALYPVRLQISADPAQSIKAVKEQLRAIPNDGIGYGLLRYLSDAAALPGCEPQISFNYLGQRESQPRADALFRWASAPTGASIGGENQRGYRLEVTCEILDGSLRAAWSYSRQQYERATIETLARDYLARLESLIEHCSRPESFGYTPADFPLAKLDQPQIDAIFGQIPGVQDAYPLAPMQTGFLFAALYQPDSTAYFTQMLIELEGQIDRQALQAAWQSATDQHPILRTGFIWEHVAAPLQYVREAASTPWQDHDLSQLSGAEQQRQLDELLRADRQQRFALDRPPLQRLTLIDLGQQRQLLVWSHHHILLDGWSLPLVIRDALAAYDQLRSGRRPALASVRPYRDFIAWLERCDQHEAERFWRGYLAGVGAPTRLASGEFEKHRATTGDREYRTCDLDFSQAQAEAFKRIAQRHHLTTNTVLQGAWSFLLSRYTRRDDVIFGVPVSGRPADLPGVEEMVGVFINTLPLRVTMSPDDDVLTLLRGIQEQTARLHEFAYNSLAKVQSWSDLPRGSALFDTLFVFENYPAARSSDDQAGAYRVADLRTVEKTEYPLTITVMTRDRMRAEFSYNPDYFDDLAVQRLAGQFNRVIEAITDSLLGSEYQ